MTARDCRGPWPRTESGDFIDEATGKTRVKPEWNQVEPFSEERAFVKKDGYWHIVNVSEEIVY